jgi:transcription elongation factor Elf1
MTASELCPYCNMKANVTRTTHLDNDDKVIFLECEHCGFSGIEKHSLRD